jgi:NAD(P)-dependent dehydrogenase (short-subunit alcohol dehydrogenase family)
MKNYLGIFSLKGKTAVLTGAAGTLGRSIAKGLGKAGADLAVCDIVDTSDIIKDFENKGIYAKGYYIDVLDKSKIQDCHDKIMSDFEKIDILVNAAGGNIKDATISDTLNFFDLKMEALQKVIILNLFGGAIIPAQVFGKSMAENKNGGSIINISSMNSFRPLTRVPGYSAAKAGVSNFTQWLSVYLAQEYNKNLRVNAIAPGFFLTAQNHYLLFDKDNNLTKRGDAIISHTPMMRFGVPDDLTGACIWLASDASRFVTGTVIPVDGGFSAYAGV